MGQEIDLNSYFIWSKGFVEDKERIFAWKPKAKTMLLLGERADLFKDTRYTGIYHWLIP